MLKSNILKNLNKTGFDYNSCRHLIYNQIWTNILIELTMGVWWIGEVCIEDVLS